PPGYSLAAAPSVILALRTNVRQSRRQRMTKHYNMYRMARTALLAGLMVLASGLASAQAPRCSVLTGTYAMTFSGTFVAPGTTVPMPFNGVGIVTFDPAGKWTGVESGNFGFSVLRSAPFSGTYTLNPDCTGTSTGKLPDGTTTHSDFVVADG